MRERRGERCEGEERREVRGRGEVRGGEGEERREVRGGEVTSGLR